MKSPVKWIDPKPEIKKLPKWQAAWLAGIIDSDGSIGLYDYGREGRRIQVQIANVSFKFLEACRKAIGCGSNVNHIPSLSHLGRQPMFNYCLKGSCRCYWFLRQIIPFLIIKKEKAEKIVKELENKPFGRWKNATRESRRAASRQAKLLWKNPKIRAARLAGMKKHYEK